MASSRLSRQQQDTLFLIGVLAIIVVHLAFILPVWAGMLGCALLVWRAYLAWHDKPLPPKPILMAILVATLAGCAFEALKVSISGAALTLLLVLIALKPLETRNHRDLQVLYGLTFFGIVVNFFITQSMLVAALMVLAFTGLLTAIIHTHNPLGAPALHTSARMAGKLLLLGMPIIVVLYVAFPRFAPLWGIPTLQNTGKTGISNSMTVGAIASLAKDNSVALRVQFEPGSPMPNQNELYFRGPVLSRLKDNQWTADDSTVTTSQAPPGTAFNPLEAEAGTTVFRYEVLLEPHQQRWLLPLDGTQATPQSDYRSVMMRDAVWHSYQTVNTARRYQAQSYRNYHIERNTQPAYLRNNLALPEGSDPRTVQWGQELRQRFGASDADGTADAAIVNYLLQYLHTEPYHYTLEPGVYGANAADEFWFDRKQGFCEHISSAFAIVLRAAGVPARIVTGYQGGEANPVNGILTVRQSDAHAWTEVWLPGSGWQRIDPTAAIAPQRIALSRSDAVAQDQSAQAWRSATGPAWLWQMRTLVEAVEYRWSQWVLNYNQKDQESLFQRLGLERLNWSQVLLAAIGLASLTTLLYMLWPKLRSSNRQDPWLRLLEQTRQRLHKNGMDLPAHMPPRSMARHVQAFYGSQGQAIAQWLLDMERHRYGLPSPTPQQRAQALRRLKQQWKQLTWPAPAPQTTRQTPPRPARTAA